MGWIARIFGKENTAEQPLVAFTAPSVRTFCRCLCDNREHATFCRKCGKRVNLGIAEFGDWANPNLDIPSSIRDMSLLFFRTFGARPDSLAYSPDILEFIANNTPMQAMLSRDHENFYYLLQNNKPKDGMLDLRWRSSMLIPNRIDLYTVSELSQRLRVCVTKE